MIFPGESQFVTLGEAQTPGRGFKHAAGLKKKKCEKCTALEEENLKERGSRLVVFFRNG